MVGRAGISQAKLPIEVLAGDQVLWLRLYKFAYWHLGHAQDAEDAVNDSFVRSLERNVEGTGWQPDSGKPYDRFMFEIVRGELANVRRSRRREKAVPTDDPDALASTYPLPDDAIELRARQEFNEKVKAQLEDDSQGAVPLQMFDVAAKKGIDGPTDFARELNQPLNVIKAAERRIAKVATELLKTLRRSRLFNK